MEGEIAMEEKILKKSRNGLVMLLLLLPSMFISRVDPARTVRMG